MIKIQMDHNDKTHRIFIPESWLYSRFVWWIVIKSIHNEKAAKLLKNPDLRQFCKKAIKYCKGLEIIEVEQSSGYHIKIYL